MINVTVKYGVARTATIEVEEGTTIKEVLNTVRPALGFASNVKALINAQHQGGDITVRDGEIIEVENSCNEKAAEGDISVTVNYGLGRTVTTSVADGTTIQQVLDKVRPALGYTSNVKALVEGAAQPLSNTVVNGDVIDVETAANSKAV
jgi:hypothetical protein